MKITISGIPGSGKSTVAKQVAAALGYMHYSIGDFMREIALEKGISLLELSEKAEKKKWVDDALDSRLKKLGQEKEDLVIDARLGFHFIPGSIKIFLKVTREEAARRIFNDRRGTEKENLTLDKTRKNLKRRQESERLRYMKYYGLDVDNESNYDLVIDTTDLTVEKVVKKIIDFVKRTKAKGFWRARNAKRF